MESAAGLRRTLHRLGGEALDLAFGSRCVGCRREGPSLCPSCRTAFDARLGSEPGVPLGLPADIPVPLLQLEWCAPFTGTARRALHSLKYRGERGLARPLGEALAARWRRAGFGGDVLVPVPASPDRVRQRGYDQAALLAEVAAGSLRLPFLRALERTRATTAQASLDHGARATNLAGAIRVRSAPAGRWVVLVDDVVTTGATLAACAAALRAGGAAAVSAITVAREG